MAKTKIEEKELKILLIELDEARALAGRWRALWASTKINFGGNASEEKARYKELLEKNKFPWEKVK